MRAIDFDSLNMKPGVKPGARRNTRVYIASVDCLEDAAAYERALELLPAKRRESADRMKIASGKRLSAGAGLLLMAALADFLREGAGGAMDFLREDAGGEDDRAWFRALHSIRIEVAEHGKPYLPDYPEVHFNLSHSGNRVMCIVSDHEVGCDVEKIDPRPASMIIRCLAQEEQETAKRSPEHFFRIWTLKESILKLSGMGLGIELRSFAVSLDPLSVRQDFMKGPVTLKEYDALRGKTAWEDSGDREAAGDQGEAEGQGAAGDCGETEDRKKAGSREGTKAGDGTYYCCSCASAGGDLPEEMIEIDLRRYIM